MWQWFHGGWHRSAGRGQREGYKKRENDGGKERKEKGGWGGFKRERRRRIWERAGEKSELKKAGYSYTGAPQASNSGGYMNSLSLSLFLSCFSSLSVSLVHPSLCSLGSLFLCPYVSLSLSLSLGQRPIHSVVPGRSEWTLPSLILSLPFIPSFLFFSPWRGGNQNSHTSPQLIFY